MFPRAESYFLSPISLSRWSSYLTLDRWDGASDFEAFKAANGEDYRRLDQACEPLCSEERFVGRFAVR